MKLDKILSRLDSDVLQQILGDEVIRTLSLLGPEYSYSQGLHRILTNTYSFQELLINTNTRNYIIDILSEDEILILVGDLELPFKTNLWKELKKTNFNDSLINKLFSFFDLEIYVKKEEEWIQEINAKPNYPLYPYQRSVLKKVKRTLSSEKNRILLHMPTGSGKTRTTISFICRYLVENENTNVIWFANTKELLDQAYNEFIKAWTNIGDREIKVIKYWDKSTIDISSMRGAFIVAGLDKAYNALMKDIGKMSVFASRTSLVIMDEAHQAIAPTYKLLIESIIISNKASFIGLSATPGRTWNEPEEDKKLSNFFYRQKAKIEIEGYENPVDYLIKKGYLAQTINTTLLHKSGIKLSLTDLEYLQKNYVLSDKVLKKISQDSLRNIAIITKIQQLVEKHQRIILFAITVNHAVVLNSLLTALGINSKVLTSNTNPSERNNIIHDFKISRIQNPAPIVLCNYGILTTGFDAPETSCAVIARPTDSLVLYSQMIGRAIRGTISGGNDKAEIVTVIDENLSGFGAVADAFTNWDDVWDDVN
ncbi:DEAD/DEAH box helicase [Psychroflexus gondwanensis]|jgi:superfamily II DNA or RNA helicase|uniref:DEAD/DEAH box helicase n=1 Tax=Psychroflexus gondwanensis TaxID=251 RepID=UPI0011BD5D84|nr:DEAD/DEAH box helicase [Psychroflexus gondwanensis]TXE16844.1 DEAD/DEAH box helicase [Psychroflexus gondwanensis]